MNRRGFFAAIVGAIVGRKLQSLAPVRIHPRPGLMPLYSYQEHYKRCFEHFRKISAKMEAEMELQHNRDYAFLAGDRWGRPGVEPDS